MRNVLCAVAFCVACVAACQVPPHTTSAITKLIEAARALPLAGQPAALEEVVVQARKAKDTAGEASARIWAALAYGGLGQRTKALEHYKAALPLYESNRDLYGQTLALNGIGNQLSADKKYAEALQFHERALAIFEKLGDKASIASAQTGIGVDLFLDGKLDTALERFTKALATYESLENRAGQASSHGWIAICKNAQGYPKEALTSQKRAIALYEALQDNRNLMFQLMSAANSSSQLLHWREASAFAQRGVALAHAQGDSGSEATCLDLEGLAQHRMGHPDVALKAYEGSLAIYRGLGDKRRQATTLNVIGALLESLGRTKDAFSALGEAEKLCLETDLKTALAGVYGNIGNVHMGLAQYEEARKRFELALGILRDVKDESGQATSLNNLGSALFKLRELDKAKAAFEASDALYRALKDLDGEATVQNNLGSVLAEMGELKPALACYRRALQVYASIGNRRGESTGLNNVGSIYSLLNDHGQARGYFERSLAMLNGMGDLRGEASAQFNLAGSLLGMGFEDLATIQMKQAINSLQEFRRKTGGISREQLASFRSSVELRYRTLADLLLHQNRILEAQQVLDMLKDDELFRLVRRGTDASSVDLTPREKEWAAKYLALSGDIARLGEQYDLESQKDEPNVEILGGLRSKLQAAEEGFLSFVKSARDEFEKQSAKSNRLEDVANSKELGRVLANLGDSRPCAVYTLVTKDGVRMILQFANTRVLRQADSKIPIEQLNKLILDFRRTLTDPTLDPTPIGAKLYDALVRPIEKDLKDAGTKSIIWSLDGQLRYIPLSALWDSKTKQYLIEKYPNSIFTPATKDRLTDKPDANWSGVGLAVSQGRREGEDVFAPLPKAKEELDAISKALGGGSFLDDAFTEDVLTREMAKKKNKVIHIISHFKFTPGDEKHSYLLLGKGTLSLETFKSYPNLMNGVDLLVLSACETALSDTADGSEFEGFALLAQMNGAGAVIATLWPVADESTAVLMAEFYRQRASKPTATKLEALRTAQLSLMRGSLKFKPDETRSAATSTPANAGAFTRWTPSIERPVHPFYWAPFVLFGNFR